MQKNEKKDRLHHPEKSVSDDPLAKRRQPNGGVVVDGERPYDLIDGASGEILAVAREVEHLREIAADAKQPIEIRLDAYEDIIDSEVGDTSLIRARNIEREMGVRQIYLKFESFRK